MQGKALEIAELARPGVEALGLVLWGVELAGSAKELKVIVYIDRAGDETVNVDDCADVSRQLSGVMDVEEPIAEAYSLEVSSPGWDRPLYSLDQYQQMVGSEVRIKLRFPFDGRRNFRGPLKGVEGDEVVVQVDNEEYVLPFEAIEQGRVVPPKG
ncbi:ribosome maturation factor RimP [Litorivicinus lipolyticus]|uniref:Ribosome maturation factor RimP n=1 Tax=Litorivicinus lipolyticus TaxID=418701 RepID=A0A5Q2QB38_9GAMM|nr:ribosome maturation factor RimP [Litorivicinus lipolyticus]QGG79482.1 ribosome maturation factor RimP [Litorivicinus lipolyticus]